MVPKFIKHAQATKSMIVKPRSLSIPLDDTFIASDLTALTKVALHEAPVEWIEANARQISNAVEKLPGIGKVKFSNLANFVYPRFVAYMRVRLMLYSSNTSLFLSLEEKLSEWTAAGVLAQLADWQVIQRTLWDYVAECTGYSPVLEELVQLDMFCIIAHLLTIKHMDMESIVKERRSDLQGIMDLLQALLDHPDIEPVRRPLLRLICSLAESSGLYPTSLYLNGVETRHDHAVRGGSFGDIWQGTVGHCSVAIKVMREISPHFIAVNTKVFAHEAVLWRQFRHPNVLPFYGVTLWPKNPHIAGLVSPWMTNGNIIDYLARVPDANRLLLLLDIAYGVQYLHDFDPPVIHSDLKGTNILITPSGRACVADFGLCCLQPDSPSMSESVGMAGTVRFCAPELLKAEEMDNAIEQQKSLATDIYSFGCMCFEIFTGRPPFFELNMSAAIRAIIEGYRLIQPTSMNPELWDMVENCWNKDPTLRPTINDVVKCLQSQLGDLQHPQASHFEWDHGIMYRLNSPVFSSEYPRRLPGDQTHTLTQKDIIIALMGPTGTGKSSFVNTAMRHPVAVVNDSLDSSTKDVFAFGCLHPDGSGRKVILVDTPGFDGTEKSDYAILEVIAMWLQKTYSRKVTLTGVLQFHAIDERRLRGTPRRNLGMFQRLCGTKALSNVILVTTCWDLVTEEIGSQREEQLKSGLWKPMLDHGCRIARFQPSTFESAWNLIDQFNVSTTRPLKLQHELASAKRLRETSAHRFLVQWWQRVSKKMGSVAHKKEPRKQGHQSSRHPVAFSPEGNQGKPSASRSKDTSETPQLPSEQPQPILDLRPTSEATSAPSGEHQNSTALVPYTPDSSTCIALGQDRSLHLSNSGPQVPSLDFSTCDGHCITAESAKAHILNSDTLILRQAFAAVGFTGMYMIQVGFNEAALHQGLLVDEIYVFLDSHLLVPEADVCSAFAAYFAPFPGTVYTHTQPYYVSVDPPSQLDQSLPGGGSNFGSGHKTRRGRQHGAGGGSGDGDGGGSDDDDSDCDDNNKQDPGPGGRNWKGKEKAAKNDDRRLDIFLSSGLSIVMGEGSVSHRVQTGASITVVANNNNGGKAPPPQIRWSMPWFQVTMNDVELDSELNHTDHPPYVLSFAQIQVSACSSDPVQLLRRFPDFRHVEGDLVKVNRMKNAGLKLELQAGPVPKGVVGVSRDRQTAAEGTVGRWSISSHKLPDSAAMHLKIKDEDKLDGAKWKYIHSDTVFGCLPGVMFKDNDCPSAIFSLSPTLEARRTALEVAVTALWITHTDSPQAKPWSLIRNRRWPWSSDKRPSIFANFIHRTVVTVDVEEIQEEHSVMTRGLIDQNVEAGAIASAKGCTQKEILWKQTEAVARTPNPGMLSDLKVSLMSAVAGVAARGKDGIELIVESKQSSNASMGGSTDLLNSASSSLPVPSSIPPAQESSEHGATVDAGVTQAGKQGTGSSHSPVPKPTLAISRLQLAAEAVEGPKSWIIRLRKTFQSCIPDLGE